MGRPSKYSKALGERIFMRLCEGEYLKDICQDSNVPHRSTIFRWVADPDHEFSDLYARAREIQAYLMAEEILSIADDSRRDFYEDEDGNQIVNHEAIQRSRLRVDSRKWLLSKLIPHRYGDKLALDHAGSIDLTPSVKVVLNDDPSESST